jgi:hypothetical protein
MTKYLDSGPFSVHPGANKAYRDNFDKVFKGDKKDTANKEPIKAKEVALDPDTLKETAPKSKKKKPNEKAKAKKKKSK